MRNRFGNPASRLSCRELDDEIVEVSLLLPGWQVTALESAAHDRGLTAAELVRALLRDFLAEHGPGAGAEGPLALAADRH
jgi:hypothetical protein